MGSQNHHNNTKRTAVIGRKNNIKESNANIIMSNNLYLEKITESIIIGDLDNDITENTVLSIGMNKNRLTVSDDRTLIVNDVHVSQHIKRLELIINELENRYNRLKC